jgi:hypothetical protein
MVGQNRCGVKFDLFEDAKIPLSAVPELLNTTSKATIEAGNSLVVFVIADFGSATRAASSEPYHQGCPRGLHPSTVVLFEVNSSVIMRFGHDIRS